MIADAVPVRPIVAPDRDMMAGITGIAMASAAEMRAAEASAIKAGASVDSLMGRAGGGIADSVQRFVAGSPVLILCGPGNSGGGYVAGSWCSACGLDVRVAASAPRATSAAAAAR